MLEKRKKKWTLYFLTQQSVKLLDPLTWMWFRNSYSRRKPLASRPERYRGHVVLAQVELGGKCFPRPLGRAEQADATSGYEHPGTK